MVTRAKAADTRCRALVGDVRGDRRPAGQADDPQDGTLAPICTPMRAQP